MTLIIFYDIINMDITNKDMIYWNLTLIKSGDCPYQLRKGS